MLRKNKARYGLIFLAFILIGGCLWSILDPDRNFNQIDSFYCYGKKSNLTIFIEIGQYEKRTGFLASPPFSHTSSILKIIKISNNWKKDSVEFIDPGISIYDLTGCVILVQEEFYIVERIGNIYRWDKSNLTPLSLIEQQKLEKVLESDAFNWSKSKLREKLREICQSGWKLYSTRDREELVGILDSDKETFKWNSKVLSIKLVKTKTEESLLLELDRNSNVELARTNIWD
jgi:hypothetical protein